MRMANMSAKSFENFPYILSIPSALSTQSLKIELGLIFFKRKFILTQNKHLFVVIFYRLETKLVHCRWKILAKLCATFE